MDRVSSPRQISQNSLNTEGVSSILLNPLKILSILIQQNTEGLLSNESGPLRILASLVCEQVKQNGSN